MSHIEEARSVLRRSGWLTHTPPGFREDVLARAMLRAFAPGAPLYHQGDPPGGIHGLVSGGLAVLIAPGERGPHFAHFARPGFWAGEAAAFTGQPRRIGLMATRQTRTLYLPLDAIHALAAADPLTWRWLALITIGHVDLAIGSADDLMLRDPQARCVAVLLRLAGCRGTPSGPEAAADIDVTQEELATLANLSRNAVGTILRCLAAQGQVRLDYRRITIVKPAELRQRLAR
jgi:CRP/FNR family cyclic AMP-dependent transcriptional regulator